MSRTTTWNVHVFLLPDASVATQVTRLVPFAKLDPEGGVQITLAGPQLSMAVTLKGTTAEQSPGSVLTVMSDGQAILGGSVSRTITWNAQLALFPSVSFAVQTTMFVPTGKNDPGLME
jgi:hypothetical protein